MMEERNTLYFRGVLKTGLKQGMNTFQCLWCEKDETYDGQVEGENEKKDGYNRLMLQYQSCV